MLFLLALLILGIVWVASALIDNDAASMESLYGVFFLKDTVNLKVLRLLYVINIMFCFLQISGNSTYHTSTLVYL